MPAVSDRATSTAAVTARRTSTVGVNVVASPVLAPTGPYTLGGDVGVPAGTVLTATSGLPAPDATESLTLTHPVSGLSVVRTVSVWRRRRWTATISPHPGVGQTYLFDECEFDVELDNFCVDLNDDNGTADQMQPIAVFRRCTFDGNSTTGKCLVGGFAWLLGCHLTGAEDGWSGLYYSVAAGCNIVADTDSQPDPHSDAIQCSGVGHGTIYRCWLDAGRTAEAANAPLRVGTEFSAVTGVEVYYTGLAGTQHGAQFRGDAGGGDISTVTFVGNRWVNEQLYGPTDFAETTGVTWTDNRFMDGTSIPTPVP